ncbi:hypothetical protein [Streptomyces sp. C1-2]|uniref:hypothetical protein n=1 Tax=Streptomyces sp. C1-2 TaxID=2720022 RepID=UPI00143257BD|nr:hypothetical protein [Streptomyces sp. C1-2]NJP73283.1 hypothetical protein [Streptomyces sp. C1-2]
MTEPTQTPRTPDTPRSYAYCSWHRGLSSSAVLVRIIEQPSGPGVGMYACAACREKHGLRPVADQ